KLRNVVTKYPFERLHRFPVIQPNSGHRDYSRSSCDGGRRSSGLVPGSQRAVLTRTLVAENVISTDKSALLWMYCREIARGKVEDGEPPPSLEGKDAAAVSLGRRGGLKGGKARATKMFPARRAEIARKARNQKR